ncbi:hypothetical protein ACWE42_11455 [Sutcliffiella cohnii]
MQVYVYMFFASFLFAIVMVLQVNIDGDLKAMDRIQKANEFAVHDAAIPINFTDFTRGDFRFEPIQGQQNYINSINYSLNTTWNGTAFVPNENSFFQEPIKLLYIEYVDASHPSCPSFPCSFEVPITETVEHLAGPSVLAILEAESPRFFVGEPSPIRKLSIYEYK